MMSATFKCGYCNRYAKGYCAICGTLVCDDHSKLIGYMRVCEKCMLEWSISSPEDVYKLVAEESLKGADFHEIVSSRLPEEGYLFIGMDDFDSPHGMCTTYLGARILPKISNIVEFLDYPLIVRLNPNIPIKTRGNAAVGLRVYARDIMGVVQAVLKEAKTLAHSLFGKTMPAIIFMSSESYSVPKLFRETYWLALKGVVNHEELLQKVSKLRLPIKIFSPFSKPRGIVGAVSVIGAEFPDWTFELLAYRRGKGERMIDKNSVYEMDEKTRPFTFSNVDGSRVLISPGGPDPVLFGIRGDIPEALLEAFKILRHEKQELWAIYRSNQGTHFHISGEIDVYRTVYLTGEVIASRSIEETKVLVEVSTNAGIFRLHAYKLQGKLRRLLLSLKKGDIIHFSANIWEIQNGTFEANIEEFWVETFVPEYKERNPLCPICGRRMKSKGSGTYFCRNCGYRVRCQKIIEASRRRPFPTRKRLLPPPRAHRHLTMPNERVAFRFLKLSRRMKPYLIEPFFGFEKPSEFRKLREIFDPHAE